MTEYQQDSPQEAQAKTAGIAAQGRVVIRLSMITLLTLIGLMTRFITLPATMAIPRWEAPVRAFIMQPWAKGIVWLAGVRIRHAGEPPRRPFYLVSNHETFLDILILAGYTGAVFVAKSEVQDWPLVGFLSRLFNAIFIRRADRRDTRRVNEAIRAALAEGHGVAIFAEGGIGPGDHIERFKPSLLEPAAQAGYPVHWAVLNYDTPEGCPPPSEVVYWRKGLPFAQMMLRILRMPRVHAELIFGDQPSRADNRKQLAQELHREVSSRFKPLL